MTRRYAQDTTVPVKQTKEEIEALLKRYGADQFVSGWNGDAEMVSCRMRGRLLRFVVPKPRPEDHRYDPAGRRRTEAGQRNAMEQTERTAWRRVRLLLHAKLEAIAEEVSTFDVEMAPWILLPDGSTVADHVADQVDEVYRSGTMPRSLPGLPSGPNVKLLGNGR